MVVAFTFIEINYSMVSLFVDLVLPLSYLYCGIKFLAALFALFPA